MSRKCKFEDLNAGDWFILYGKIYQKDSLGCANRFSDGETSWLIGDRTVKFVKSVELIYD